jgi:hypothetical protein
MNPLLLKFSHQVFNQLLLVYKKRFTHHTVPVKIIRFVKMFEQVNVPVLGVIENMSYFIAPDTRPETSAVRPALTRVTGGLLDARFVPTATVFASLRLGGAEGADDYVDRPNRFVNGAIPAGGLAIGGWAWDGSTAYCSTARCKPGLACNCSRLTARRQQG